MTSRPLVLYLISRSVPGGAQVHVTSLLAGFRDRFEVVLGAGEEGHLTESARQLGVSVRVLPVLRSSASLRGQYRGFRDLLTTMGELSPALVHAHSTKSGFLGRLAARACDVPPIFTAHGWAFADGTGPLRRAATIPLEWRAASWARRIIAVSEADRSLALRYRITAPEKIVTIHNGIPDTHEAPAARPADVVRIIMVARFEPPKDQELLLDALARLDARYRVLFVGDGPRLARARALANASGLAERVDFLGSRHDVPELLAQAHVFVLTSRWEGFPLAVLEAMRAGLPVVASNVGGIREAVVHGVTGFLVPPGDRDALHTCLARLGGAAELRADMGRAGRRRYEAEFTVDRMLRSTEAVYAEVLREQLRAAG